MKFSIHRDALLEAIQSIQSVVEKKNSIQILSNILCTVQQNSISLSATDLELGMRVSVKADVDQEGKITFSAKHFFDIVKELPSQKVEVKRKNNEWVEIISGKSRFNIVSLSADEYPILPAFEEKKYTAARSTSLAEMIDRTAFAVSTDTTRYFLNGVYFENLNQNLYRMTATDGHRLSFIDQEIFLENPELKKGAIIPKKGVQELRKLIEHSPEQIDLCFEKGYLFARSEQTYLYIRLIEGEYPDYRSAMPKETEMDKVAEFNRDQFTSAIKRVSLLAHEKSKGVKFSFQKGLLTISSSNPDMGEAQEELEVSYSGEPVEIGFNAKYILECLNVMKTEILQFRFQERLKPGFLQEKEKPNHTYVILPMRI